MFNATQTYKDRLIKRLEEEDYSDITDDFEAGFSAAMCKAIEIIRDDDLPPVVDAPHKIKES